jgi:hypothetical protein
MTSSDKGRYGIISGKNAFYKSKISLSLKNISNIIKLILTIKHNYHK